MHTAETSELNMALHGFQYRGRCDRSYAWRAGSNKERTQSEKSSETALRRVLAMDPTDGRAYVSLGKLLLQQKRIEEARRLYDDGAAATGKCLHAQLFAD